MVCLLLAANKCVCTDQNIAHLHPWNAFFLSFGFFASDKAGESLFTTISLIDASFLPGGVACEAFDLD